jgi:hypothetical protein
VITASKKGYFINKGYAPDGTGNEVLSYEAISPVYSTLVELLKASSAHFASHIELQGYSYHKPTKSSGLTAAAAESVFTETNSTVESKGAERAGDSNVQRKEADAKAPKDGKKWVKPAKVVNNKKSTEPSLKWKALGLKGETNKDRKPKTAEKKKLDSKLSVDRLKSKSSSIDDDFEASEDDEQSEDDQPEKRDVGTEMSHEYYQIQKLVKYLRSGNQTVTIIAICSLREYDLSTEFNQLAIRDVGGLETLVNLLDTNDTKCQNGALKILKDISKNGINTF